MVKRVRRNKLRLLNICFLSVIALLGLSFAILNANPVMVDYYIGAREIPLSFLLVVVFILGIFLGFLSSIPTYLRLKCEIRRLMRERG